MYYEHIFVYSGALYAQTKLLTRFIKYKNSIPEHSDHIHTHNWPILKSRLKTGLDKKIWRKNEFSCAIKF